MLAYVRGGKSRPAGRSGKETAMDWDLVTTILRSLAVLLPMAAVIGLATLPQPRPALVQARRRRR